MLETCRRRHFCDVVKTLQKKYFAAFTLIMLCVDGINYFIFASCFALSFLLGRYQSTCFNGNKEEKKKEKMSDRGKSRANSLRSIQKARQLSY